LENDGGKMRRILLFAFIFFLNGLIIGCGKKVGEKKKEEGTIPVKVREVKRGDIEEIISLTGDIHGITEVKVFAKVPGRLIKKIKREGDRVKKDEVIALIDRDEPAMKFSKAIVKSPINGILTMYFVDLGDAVFPPPSEPLCMVADMDSVKVVVNLSEKDIGKVKKGKIARVYVDSYPRKVFYGRVTNVAPALNPMTRKLKVEITVKNSEHLLKPGMFARVEIIVDTFKNVLIVPRKAILEEEDGDYVFIVENGISKKVKVLKGACDGKNVEIKKGLKEKDLVVVEGNYELIEGVKVKIEE